MMSAYIDRMLILLGGFLGSGRRSLSRQLASTYGFHYYNIDDKKLHRGIFDANKQFREHTLQPVNDGERRALYERIVADLPLLSKMYSNVILDDVFHRSASRDYFFEQARKYFNPVVFVWIDSNDMEARQRIESQAKNGLIESVTEGLRMRGRTKKGFQPFVDPVPAFTYSLSDTNASEKLFAMIQSAINS